MRKIFERLARLSQETKKEYSYDKDADAWYWYNRGQPEQRFGPYSSFLDVQLSAVDPYSERSAHIAWVSVDDERVSELVFDHVKIMIKSDEGEKHVVVTPSKLSVSVHGTSGAVIGLWHIAYKDLLAESDTFEDL